MTRARALLLVSLVLLSAVALPATGTAAADWSPEGQVCLEADDAPIPILGDILAEGCETWGDPSDLTLSAESQSGARSTAEEANKSLRKAETETAPEWLNGGAAPDLYKDIVSEMRVAYDSARINNSSQAEAESAAHEAGREYVRYRIAEDLVSVNDKAINKFFAVQNNSNVSVEWMAYGSADEVREGSMSLFESSETPMSLNYSYIYISSASTPDRDWLHADHSLISMDNQQDYGLDSITVSFDSPALNATEYSSTHNRGEALPVDDYLNTYQTAENEISNFSDALDESQYDNLSTEDLLSAPDLRQQYGTNYSDGGGSGFGAALARDAGLAANIGMHYNVSLLEDDQYVEGSLFGDQSDFVAQNSDNSTEIKTGKIYDGANMTSFVLPDDSDVDQRTLNQDFEVARIESANGEQMDSVNLTTGTDRDWTQPDNAGFYDQLREDRRAALNYSEMFLDSSGSDDGLPPLGVSDWGIIEWAAVISAIIGLILLIAAAARS